MGFILDSRNYLHVDSMIELQPQCNSSWRDPESRSPDLFDSLMFPKQLRRMCQMSIQRQRLSRIACDSNVVGHSSLSSSFPLLSLSQISQALSTHIWQWSIVQSLHPRFVPTYRFGNRRVEGKKKLTSTYYHFAKSQSHDPTLFIFDLQKFTILKTTFFFFFDQLVLWMSVTIGRMLK